MNESDLALKHFTRSAEIMNIIGSKLGSAAALLAKGRLYADIGRHDEAQNALLSALNDFKDMNSLRKAAATLISLINVLLDKKELEEAYIYIEEALSISRENGFLSEEGKSVHLFARALRQEGKISEAKAKYEETIEIFGKLGRDKEVSSVKKELEILTDLTR